MWMRIPVRTCYDWLCQFLRYQPLGFIEYPCGRRNHQSTCHGSFFLILILLLGGKKKKNACQMLAVFWHTISNDAKWPHGLMCPGVKQGCPDQPMTPGSFIRLCSRHSSIDKGHWKGHRLSLFTSIQLKHQQLNQCRVFIGTLIVFIDWQVVQQSVHWAPHINSVGGFFCFF